MRRGASRCRGRKTGLSFLCPKIVGTSRVGLILSRARHLSTSHLKNPFTKTSMSTRSLVLTRIQISKNLRRPTVTWPRPRRSRTPAGTLYRLSKRFLRHLTISAGKFQFPRLRTLVSRICRLSNKTTIVAQLPNHSAATSTRIYPLLAETSRLKK